MIIGTKKVYFRYDRKEDVFGVIPGSEGWNWSNRINRKTAYLTRAASEDLNWTAPGFTNRLINDSTGDSVVEEFKESAAVPMTELLARTSISPVSTVQISQSHSPSSIREDSDIEPVLESDDSDIGVNVAPAISGSVSDARFWELISVLGWVDRDEIVRTSRYLQRRHNQRNRRDLFGGMLRFIIPLREKFADIAPFQNLSRESQMNFFYHLIAKGQGFYEFTLEDPIISMYLFENKVQNLYTFLRQTC
jgi:hypothetical protein